MPTLPSDLPYDAPADLDEATQQLKHLQRRVVELEQANEQASNEQRCFRQLAEHIREVFWMTNPLGDQLVYISPAYEHIWGQTCQSLHEDPGKRLAWVNEADRARVLTAFKRDARNGNYDETFRIDRPDGQTRWIRDRAFPVFDDSGEVYRLAGFAVDITQAVDDHDRSNRLGQALASKERTSVFAALGTGLAHDLGQPLTAARNFIAQARHSDQLAVDDNGVPLLKRADNEIERAVAVIRHLRDFAREGRPTRTHQSLAPILDQVHQLLDPQLRAGDIQYIPPEPASIDELALSIDGVFAQQILRNLVANAIDAAADRPTDGPSSRITLSVDHQNPAHVEISVSDNGPGIDDDVSLFEPFATTKDEGLGLGLSVSRSLAESHGGSLFVAHRGCNGDSPTTFVLRLPR